MAETDLISLVERLGLLGALMVAVGILWIAWAQERVKLDEARKTFDRRIEELQRAHLEDIRLLAGMNRRMLETQGFVEQYRRETDTRPPVPAGGD